MAKRDLIRLIGLAVTAFTVLASPLEPTYAVAIGFLSGASAVGLLTHLTLGR